MNQTPVKELTKKYHHAKILDACRKLFAEKGYENVTSDEIACVANYSKRTIYVYFPSKEDILQQLQQDSLQKYTQALSAATITCLEDYLQFTRSYLTGSALDLYYIKRIRFCKSNERDYFYFTEHFKPLFQLLRDVYHCNIISPDLPLLIWNSLLYSIENDIPIGRLNQLLLHGLAGAQ